ncbi:MAG: hypothetical protein CMH53_03560 [Myxococcales bacterium]|nr:hypothetical protein [Myxococcales bacterium]
MRICGWIALMALVLLPMAPEPAAARSAHVMAPVASSSYCYRIRDRDEKHYCLARAKKQSSYCYSIRNRDKKNFCLAEVKGQRSYCYSIRNRDQKNACLARVR